MPPESPKSDDASMQPDTAEAARDKIVPGNLETFEIDVAAGNSTDLKQAANVRDSDLLPLAGSHLPSVLPTAVQTEIPEGILLEESADEDAPPSGLSSQSIQIESLDDEQPEATAVARRVARQSSWWLSSFSLHVIALVFLAFTSLAIPREEELQLYASSAVYEPLEEEVFEDVDIDLSEELDQLEEEFDEPDPAPLEDLTSETLFEDAAVMEASSTEAATTEMKDNISELTNLFGESGAGLTGRDSEVGAGTGGGMAKFFGTEVKARRILYMLDNSGGMRRDGKFEALVSELKRSVSALGPKQEFYVIFYSDTVYPLFYPQGIRKFVRPNDRNEKLLDRWLRSVELCVGNAIDEAIAAAEVIRPEAVFLLTDGDLFTTAKKKSLLLNPTGRSYTIHTFGLGVGENSKTAAGLKQVAAANSGTFRAVPVTEEMEAQARATQRPYHNKEPGPVWGLQVGRR